jgi:hypothetical protein
MERLRMTGFALYAGGIPHLKTCSKHLGALFLENIEAFRLGIQDGTCFFILPKQCGISWHTACVTSFVVAFSFRSLH